MDWSEVCRKCPHSAERRCETRGVECDEVRERAGLSKRDYYVTATGGLRERRVPRRQAPIDSAAECLERRDLQRTENLGRETFLHPDAGVLEKCPPGCQGYEITTDPPFEIKYLGQVLPPGYRHLPPGGWYCGRCDCPIRHRRLPEPGRCEYESCMMCRDWKFDRYNTPFEYKAEMSFQFSERMPLRQFEFSCREDFDAVEKTLKDLDAFIDGSPVQLRRRLFWVATWALFGFADQNGLRRPTSAELVGKLPRLGRTARTFRRDLQHLGPVLGDARTLLNKGYDPADNDLA